MPKQEPESLPPSFRQQPQATYALGAATPMRVLVIKCSNLFLRYSYFDTSSDQAVAWGTIQGIDTSKAGHHYNGPRGNLEEPLDRPDHRGAILAAANALTHPARGVLSSLDKLDVVGHYVVHGGTEWDSAVLVTGKVRRLMEKMTTLAPLHVPANLLGIEECERLMPGVPQVAVFDTAFHQKMPPAAYKYPIPRHLDETQRLRRYGYHGILHEFAARCAARHLGRSLGELKLITCNLDHGASMAAVEYGRSIDTSMGLTPLEGMVMSTRSGSLDPGLLLYLQDKHKLNTVQLSDTLNRLSGVKALARLPEEVCALDWSPEEGNCDAFVAMQCFCYHSKKYMGAYLAALGSADAVVFTGSIGEREAGVRARICQGLAPLGILLDEEANKKAAAGRGEAVEVSGRESRIRILVVGADEQRMIAQHAIGAIERSSVVRNERRNEHHPIPVAISAHHVHLTREHFERLFGAGREMTWYAELSQPGQFACQEKVTLAGPKGRIERVRVLGPFRKASQVEISKTEEYMLGVSAPIRASGNLDGSPGIRLEGPAGAVDLERGVICALRHIHMTPDDALQLGLRDKDIVSVRICERERSLVFGDVLVRSHPDYALEMHIDTDEANAAGVPRGAVCYLDSIQKREQTEAYQEAGIHPGGVENDGRMLTAPRGNPAGTDSTPITRDANGIGR